MKLVVLGATGATGLEIVRQALEHGHSVTAFVRSPERLNGFRDRITVQQGDLLNSAELERVIEGHDAVLSGFGPRVPVSKADADLLRRFAIALTSAMLRAGVRRVVGESVAFLFKDSIIPPVYFLGRLFFPGMVADPSAMEQVFDKSGFRHRCQVAIAPNDAMDDTVGWRAQCRSAGQANFVRRPPTEG